jgi:hypothetical protein
VDIRSGEWTAEILAIYENKSAGVAAPTYPFRKSLLKGSKVITVNSALSSGGTMMSCQTVHDCLAIQTRMVRDNWEAFLHTTRRASEQSTKLADDAVKQMGDAAFAPR